MGTPERDGEGIMIRTEVIMILILGAFILGFAMGILIVGAK